MYKGADVMKKSFVVMIPIIIVVFLSSASSEGIVSIAATNKGLMNAAQEDKLIIVHKRIGDDGHQYDTFAKITNNEQIVEIEKLLGEIQWQNAKVLMSRTPDYTINLQNDKSSFTTSLWISTSQEIVELVIREQNKYVRLDEEKSSILLELLTA